MFYRQYKTFLYHFCNLKHFLKAENSEDSLAGSCAEKYTGSSCNPVVTGLLLEPDCVLGKNVVVRFGTGTPGFGAKNLSQRLHMHKMWVFRFAYFLWDKIWLAWSILW